jgi:20S proteasome alpha/beta subunit
MTVVIGVRCHDAVILAADSQRTEGRTRETIPKLFVSPSGVVWGSAGSIAIQQELFALMNDLPVARNPGRLEARDATVRALRDARTAATKGTDEPTEVALGVDGLFGWFSAQDRRSYLLRVHGAGNAEFARSYTAVGSVGEMARFALSRMEFLGYNDLPLEAAKMVAFGVADDVIRAAASGVGAPVQLAVANVTGSSVLGRVDLRAVEDTVAAFRDYQREYLVRDQQIKAEPDTGVRPNDAESLADVLQAWSDVLEVVRAENAMLAALLADSRPSELIGDDLVIAFGEGRTFFVRKAQEERNRAVLGKAIRDCTGRTLRLRFISS